MHYRHGTLIYMDDGKGNVFDENDPDTFDDEDF